VSITIEVTGNSIPEVADKLLAIGASLRASTAVLPIANGGTGAQTIEEVMEAAEVAPTPKSQAPSTKSSAPVEITSNGHPNNRDALEAAKSSDLSSPTTAPKSDVPDFDTVVTPLVLKLVEVKGKPAAQEVLGRFGVIKASHLSDERWQELVNAINDELAA
jgi:hypothetical protein